jgi:plastocyanin
MSNLTTVRVRVLVAALAAAAAIACGGSSTSTPTPTSPTPPSGSTVSIVSGASARTTTAYNPSPITVAHGTAVTWVNNDTIAHTSTGDGGAWDSGLVAPGSSFSFTFSSAGTFTYHCAVHPNMVGTVTVQ